MQRTFLALILAGLSVPAFAQSAPATSGIPDNAHAAMTSEPHPAATAYANAVAGRNNAARIEACGRVARGFLDQLEKGDFKSATSNFNATMAAALGADKLAETWQSLGAQLGKLESRGKPQTVMYQGMPVVSTPLHFANGDFVSQLACDKDGKIAGFYIRPAQPTTAAPASSAQ